MRSLRITLAALAVAFLAACASPPAGTPALSPREQADPILTSYAAVLVAADAAVTSPLIASKPDIKKQIQASSHAATAAVLAYGDKAASCFRDPVTNVVDNAPGKVCDASALSIAKAEAQTLISQVGALTSAFGFKPLTVPAAPAAVAN